MHLHQMMHFLGLFSRKIAEYINLRQMEERIRKQLEGMFDVLICVALVLVYRFSVRGHFSVLWPGLAVICGVLRSRLIPCVSRGETMDPGNTLDTGLNQPSSGYQHAECCALVCRGMFRLRIM